MASRVVDLVKATTILLAGLAMMATVAASRSLEANGGTLRLSRAVTGPYLVSAWTQPDPPRVGRLDVSIAVMVPATGEAVLDARARLSAQRPGGRNAGTGTRLERGGGGNLLLYHGILEMQEPGPWRVAIDVEGPDGTGQATFELDVRPPLPLAGPILGGVAVLVVGGAVWWARSRRQSRSR